MALSFKAALFGSAALVLTTAPALAQDVSEELVITGTRIRGIEPVGSSVQTLGRDDIEQTAGKTVMDVLKSVPQILNFGINELTRAGAQSNVTRAGSVNIHGLGSGATLVLLNGRRGPAMGTFASYLDPSYVPAVALERVEIIADGSSAIYGADAVAGVVNLLTRRNFKGVEGRARFGVADGYETRQFGVIGGTDWASGRFVAAYDYGWNTSLNGLERDFVRSDLRSQGGTDYRGTQCAPGNIVVGGVFYAIPAGGVTPATAGQLTPGANLCETFRNQQFLPQQDRHNLYASFEQDLTESIRFSAEAYYMKRTFEEKYTAGGTSALATFTVPATNPFFVRPPGTTGAVSVQYDLGRFDYRPALTAEGETETYGGTAGLTFDLPAQWQAELSGTYHYNFDQLVNPQADTTQLNLALADTNPATAFNPFNPGSTSAATMSRIFSTLFRPTGENKLKMLEARADGPLFNLPGGPVRAAVGVSYQYSDNYQPPIRFGLAGPIGNGDLAKRQIYAAYGELYIPLIGESMAVPLAQQVSLSIAGRSDHYSDVGDTFNPKFGVDWSVNNDLRFNASYGTSFRAPLVIYLSENFPATSASFPSFPDPLSPTRTSQGLQRVEGNPDLEPETARTISFGGTFAPASGPRVSLTYWDVIFENQVLQPSALTTYLQDPAYANRVIRNPTTAQVDAMLARLPPPTSPRPPVVSWILDLRPLNQGRTEANGIDFDISQSFSTDNAGTFDLSIGGTRYLEYLTKTGVDDPIVSRLSTINNPVRWRFRAGAGWSGAGAEARLFANYASGYVNTASTPRQNVSDYTTIDAHLSQKLGKIFPGAEETRISLDVSNLFDNEPPFVNINGGFDPVQASLIGRVVTLGLTANW